MRALNRAMVIAELPRRRALDVPIRPTRAEVSSTALRHNLSEVKRAAGPVQITVANPAIIDFYMYIVKARGSPAELKWTQGLIGLICSICFGGNHRGKLKFFYYKCLLQCIY